MPKISMEKKYKTRNGETARVLCVDSGCEDFPIVAIVENKHIRMFTEDGFLHTDKFHHDHDLVEDTPYADFKIDEPVMVKKFHGDWHPRHFAGISHDGLPLAWNDGGTSHTTTKHSSWTECRRPTEQELKGTK